MASSRSSAILMQRCPICLQGKVFHSLLGTNKNCPHCGVKFERETGYFLTSMFFAYALGFILIAPTAFFLHVRQTDLRWFLGIITIGLLLLWPIIFRYSRVLWLHADQAMDPRRAEELEPPSDLNADGIT